MTYPLHCTGKNPRTTTSRPQPATSTGKLRAKATESHRSRKKREKPTLHPRDEDSPKTKNRTINASLSKSSSRKTRPSQIPPCGPRSETKGEQEGKEGNKRLLPISNAAPLRPHDSAVDISPKMMKTGRAGSSFPQQKQPQSGPREISRIQAIQGRWDRGRERRGANERPYPICPARAQHGNPRRAPLRP
jgi:hypothetical protein